MQSDIFIHGFCFGIQSYLSDKIFIRSFIQIFYVYSIVSLWVKIDKVVNLNFGSELQLSWWVPTSE